MLTSLNRILLSRESESIVTHRVQYVKSFETLVPRIDIRSDITQRMADMQTRSRRVWEHIQHIILRAIFINLDFVGFSFGPTALPLLLNGPEIVFHIVDFVLSLSQADRPFQVSMVYRSLSLLSAHRIGLFRFRDTDSILFTGFVCHAVHLAEGLQNTLTIISAHSFELINCPMRNETILNSQ